MKIAGIVISAHAVLVAGLLYFHPRPVQPKPRKPVSVHTFYLQEEAPKAVQQLKSIAETPPGTSKPVEQPKQKPAKIPKPKPVAVAKPKPKIVEKPKPPVQNKTPSQPKKDTRRDELALMMQQSLASLGNRPAEAKTTAEPKQISALASEALTFEAAYQDRLVAFLQKALMLPEKGDVKLMLTVNRSGGVQGVTIKSAASEKNQKYVEDTIHSLLLPPLENNFKGESAHTFSITLTSS